MERKISDTKVRKGKGVRKERAYRDESDKEEIHYHYHTRPEGERSRPGWYRQDKPGEVHYHYYYEPPQIRKERSSKPGIAGALLVITAVLGLLSAGLMFGGAWFMGNMGGGFEFFGVDDKADVWGTVEYVNGTPADNVTISIVGEPLTTQTSENGKYMIYNVPTGNQEINVEKAGYNTIIYKAFINPPNSNQDKNKDDKDNDKDNDKNEFDFTITTGDRIIERGSYPPFEMIRNILYVCAIVIIIFSIIALIGGVFAFKRKNFKIALLGSILGLFTVIGTLFALISIFILVISRKEFDEQEQKP